jgi:hypothetical protein
MMVPGVGAASLLDNGEFTGSLEPWIVEGVAGNTGDTLVFADGASTRIGVFQTGAVPLGFTGFALSFDFISGLSPTVGQGFLLDTFFPSLYLGGDDFGSGIAGGVFDQAISLFDLDANGVFNPAPGGTFGPSPKGAGWTQFSLSQITAPGFVAPGFATVAFEFFDLNGTAGDSVVAVDNVVLLAIVPEPAVGALLGLASLLLGGRRRHGQDAS